MNLHLTPGRGLAAFERLFTELAKGPEAAAAATYEPWLLVDQHLDSFSLGQLQAANAVLDRVEAAARRDGNRRVLALASQYRGDCHQRVHEIEAAIAAYAVATPVLEALGDRYQLVCNLDLRAYLHLRLGDVERAQPLVEAAEALLVGRDMRGCEREILHTRLDMAIRQRDGDRAAEIKDELEAEEAASAASQKRLIAARAELSQVEADRFAAEEQLRLTAERALDRARNQRTLAGAGIILALTVLAAVTWRSRRKLVLANAALAEQMQRAEVAQAAKAQLEERMRQLERTESLGTMAAGGRPRLQQPADQHPRQCRADRRVECRRRARRAGARHRVGGAAGGAAVPSAAGLLRWCADGQHAGRSGEPGVRPVADVASRDPGCRRHRVHRGCGNGGGPR